MAHNKHRNRPAAIEQLESRTLLSTTVCQLYQPTSDMTLHVGNLFTGTIVAEVPFTISGITLPAGIYTAAQINALLYPTDTPTTDATPTPSTAHITLSTTTSQIISGQTTATLTASITDASGNPIPTGQLTFYEARPVYDVSNTGQTQPCLDEAAKSKTTLGTADITNGQAQLTISNLDVGLHWIWAQYAPSDTLAPITSSYVELSAKVPVALHIEHSPTPTLANPPQIAVTLTHPDTSPLLYSGFATASTSGAIHSATATADVTLAPLSDPGFTDTQLFSTYRLSNTRLTTITGPITGWDTYLPTGLIAISVGGTGGVIGIGGDNGYGTVTWTHRYYTAPTPSGTIAITENRDPLVSASVTSQGTAWLQSPSLSLGHHVLTATYQADPWFTTDSSSTTEFDIIRNPVHVQLSSTATDIFAGKSLSLRSDVITTIRDVATPTGQLALLCDGQPCGNLSLGSSVSPLNLNLPAGDHVFQTLYNGDTYCDAGTSDPLTIHVHANQPPQGTFKVTASGSVYGTILDTDSPSSQLLCYLAVDRTLYRLTANQTDALVGRSTATAHTFARALPKLSTGRHTIRLFAVDANLGTNYQIGRAVTVNVVPVASQTRASYRYSPWWSHPTSTQTRYIIR